MQKQHSYHNPAPIYISFMIVSLTARTYSASQTWKYPTDFSYTLLKCIFEKCSLNETPLRTSHSLQVL